MYSSIQEALTGLTPTDLARRIGCHPSVTSRLIAGKSQFISANLAEKIRGIHPGIDLSGFVRKPDQKRKRSGWSLAARRRLRRSRAAKRAWAMKRDKSNWPKPEASTIPFLFIKTGRLTGIVIDTRSSKMLGKATYLESREIA